MSKTRGNWVTSDIGIERIGIVRVSEKNPFKDIFETKNPMLKKFCKHFEKSFWKTKNDNFFNK